MRETYQKIKYLYLDKKFLIDCILLSVLFFANTFLPVFTYISFTLLFILVLTSDLKKTLSYLFFCGAFCTIDFVPSLILFIICVVIYLFRFCFKKFYIEKTKFNKTFLILLAALLVYLLFPFKNIYDGMLIVRVLFIFLVIFIFYLIIYFSQDFNIKINIRLLGYGLIISSAYALFCNLVAPGLRSIGFEGSPFRFMALFFNPNGLAVTCELAIGILGYFIASKQYNRKDIFCFIAYAIIGISTASKTFLILLFLTLVLMLIFNAKKVSRNGWILIGSIIALGIALVIIKFDVVIDMLHRFVRTDVTGISNDQFLNILTTRRYDLWSGYIDYMLKNPWVIFFGRGLSAPIIGELKPHNVYLSGIYKMGVLGVGLLALIVIFMIKDAKKQGRVKLTKAIIIPLMICALLACIEDLIFHI